jgi:hypothetical protein
MTQDLGDGQAGRCASIWCSKVGLNARNANICSLKPTRKPQALKLIKVGHQVEVNEAVGQRGRHLKHGGSVGLAVACSPDEPSFWHAVAAYLPVQDELLRDALHGGWRHVDFIEKQNALCHWWAKTPAETSAKPRFRPPASPRRSVGASWLRRKVNQLQFVLGSHIGHDAGLANAGRTPEHQAELELLLDQAGEVRG